MKKALTLLLMLCMLANIAVCSAESNSFSATAKGFGGEVTVTLEIEDGVIVSATAVGELETPGIGGRAVEVMPAEMVQNNSVDVDALSGASFTSSAILTAAAEALAMYDGELKTVDAEAYVPDMTPGTYTAERYGKWDNYSAAAGMFGAVEPVVPMKISVTVDEHNILDIQVTDICETPGFYEPVVEQMLPAIIDYQSLGVDTVTGCTITSSAVLSGVEEALSTAGADTSRMYSVKPVRSTEVENYETDLAVVGAGGAGTAAALAAFESGKNVIVFEKTAKVGGMSSQSTGMIAPENKIALEAGMDASAKDMVDSFLSYSYGTANNNIVRKIVTNTGATADWLVEHGYEGMPVFGGQTLDLGKGTEKLQRLYDKFILTDENNKLLLLTAADKLITDDDGNVIGVHGVKQDGTEVNVYAKAVVLADGGFGGNKEMLKEYFGTDNFWTVGCTSSTGDALNMALEVGAALSNEISPHLMEGAGNAVINMADYRFNSLNYCGLLQVDSQGYRFMNEMFVITDPLAKGAAAIRSAGTFYMIFDQATFDALRDGGAAGLYSEEDVATITEKYNWRGWALPPYGDNMEWETNRAIENKQGWKADSIEELGQKIAADCPAFDPDAFNAEIARYQDFTHNGVDEDFGKDPIFLVPVDNGPFYAIRMEPAIFGTYGGIRVDQNMRVVNEDLAPIAGLYAAGQCCGDMFGYPYYDAAGVTQGFAYTSGRLAALDAVERMG